MANILPAGSMLPAIQENIQTRVQFTVSLDVGETLKSINIIDRRPNVGISVDRDSFFGEYRDAFQIDKGSIKVRLRANGEIQGFDSWDSLPPAHEADIFEWNAPSVLTTDYSYTVKLVYIYTAPTEPGLPPPTPVEKELVKVYNQTVHGNWNVWANRLRSYVSASGPYPKG